MNVGFEAMIIIILIIIIIYLFYLHNYNSQLLKVKSTVDNKEYYVQDKEDSQDAHLSQKDCCFRYLCRTAI